MRIVAKLTKKEIEAAIKEYIEARGFSTSGGDAAFSWASVVHEGSTRYLADSVEVEVFRKDGGPYR